MCTSFLSLLFIDCSSHVSFASPSPSCLFFCQAVGVELDLGAIASAATNAAKNGLEMDTYYPQEVPCGLGNRRSGVFFV